MLLLAAATVHCDPLARGADDALAHLWLGFQVLANFLIMCLEVVLWLCHGIGWLEKDSTLGHSWLGLLLDHR